MDPGLLPTSSSSSSSLLWSAAGAQHDHHPALPSEKPPRDHVAHDPLFEKSPHRGDHVQHAQPSGTKRTSGSSDGKSQRWRKNSSRPPHSPRRSKSRPVTAQTRDRHLRALVAMRPHPLPSFTDFRNLFIPASPGTTSDRSRGDRRPPTNLFEEVARRPAGAAPAAPATLFLLLLFLFSIFPPTAHAAKIAIMVSGNAYHFDADLCTAQTTIFNSFDHKYLFSTRQSNQAGLFNFMGTDVGPACVTTHPPRLKYLQDVWRTLTKDDEVVMMLVGLRICVCPLAKCVPQKSISYAKALCSHKSALEVFSGAGRSWRVGGAYTKS